MNIRTLQACANSDKVIKNLNCYNPNIQLIRKTSNMKKSSPIIHPKSSQATHYQLLEKTFISSAPIFGAICAKTGLIKLRLTEDIRDKVELRYSENHLSLFLASISAF